MAKRQRKKSPQPQITKTQQIFIIIAVILAGLGLVLWFTRPLLHWFFMWAYINPVFWQAIIGAILISGLYCYLRGKKTSPHEKRDIRDTAIISLGILILIGWIVLGPLQVMYPQCYLSGHEHLDVTEIANLPNIEPAALRIMPLTVSERYAKDALQYPRFQLGTGDITFINKTPQWTYPLIPDGAINFFALKDRGAVYVNMTTSKKNAKIAEQDMEIGEGMGITDWYRWKLYKIRYWVTYEDPYFLSTEQSQSLYIAVPVVSYEYHWRFPTLYTVPKWGGIALIDSNGNMEFLTPEEAIEHPILENQKLYPVKLSRYYVNSFRYRHGIVNRLFYHHEQLEIAEVPEQGNEQPFLVVTKEGIKWFIACEPYGEAHGIFRIYLVDARTGKIEWFKQPKTEALLGPVKACNYVRKANPIVDWTRFKPVEPIPIITNGELYWHTKVIPNDSAGISFTTFVDAKTGDVFEFKTDGGVKKFVAEGGKGKATVKPEGEAEKKERGVVATIIIKENGQEKQKIDVYSNQTFVVVPQGI